MNAELTDMCFAGLRHRVLPAVGLLIAFLAATFFSEVKLLAQGEIAFGNKIAGVLDAPITYSNGIGISDGYTAQLFGGVAGTPIDLLAPWLPTTGFRNDQPGYLVLSLVRAPLPIGSDATIQVRVFDGVSWEESDCRGQSRPVTVQLGGLPGSPPAPLVGLEAFSVNCVPEPSAGALLLLGTLLFALTRRRGSS